MDSYNYAFSSEQSSLNLKILTPGINKPGPAQVGAISKAQK